MTEAFPLSDDLLHAMRNAARKSIELREPVITPRAILLALLDDAVVGPALTTVVNRDKVLAAQFEESIGSPDDTLAFKTPDGRTSLWLSREAYAIFLEGAQRVQERYTSKHLALGLAAQARLSPGILSAIRVDPGALSEAIYKL